MCFLAKILNFIILLRVVTGDVVICENNECKTAALVNKNSLLYEFDTIKEASHNLSLLLEDLRERIDSKLSSLTTKIEKLEVILRNQAQYEIDETANEIEIDNEFYDNLWIVIQTRQDGAINFYRNWTEYKQGFGDETGEFFVGLDKIADLTNDRQHELLIMLEDFEGYIKFAHYDHFVIGDEGERYRLKQLGKYSGTAGNHLKFHTNKFFTTKDKDNDDSDDGNCAHWFKGGWWYYNCMTSNLNGPYRYSRNISESERGVGITWGSYDDIIYSYKATQMLLRAKPKKVVKKKDDLKKN